MIVLRELWNNKARTLLVVMSISVGIFAVGAIANSWIVLLDDLNTAYQATNPASAILSVEPFDEGLVSAVESRRDVAQAEGRRSVIVKLRTPTGQLINLNLQAVDDFATLEISRISPQEGAWPPGRRQLLLERSWEETLGFQIGDTAQIEMPDGREYDVQMAGYAHDLHQPPAGNSEIAYGYVSTDTLQWLGEPRAYNQLYLTVAGDALNKDRISVVVAEVKDQVIERNGYTVFSTLIPTPGEQFLTPIIKAVLLVLGVVGVFSLVLSGALVVNTVSAVIARQVRQIGVMKAVGGRRSQIMETYLVSVVLYGLLALSVAVPLALLGSRAFTTYFSRTGNFDILTTGLPLGVVVLEVGLSLLVPVVAASIPVSFGTRITVREAISSYGIGNELGSSLIDRLASRIRGVPGTVALSLRNTFRRKARLALTLGTLTLAGAVFVSVLSVRNSLFASFREALVYIQYDLSVDLGDAYRAQRIEREALRVPGIVSAESWLQKGAVRVRADGIESTNYVTLGVPTDSTFLDPVLVEGRWLQPGDHRQIVVNTDFLREEPDVRVGDTIVLTIDGKDDTWEVVGIVTKQYTGPVIYAGYDDLSRTVNQAGLANQVVLGLAETTSASQARVAEDFEDRFKRAGMLVGSTTTRSEFVDTFEMRFTFLIVFLMFMALLLAFVGGLGLAGTIGLNVLERIREIGVMRAIGATDGAIQRIVLAEGVVIGTLSWGLAALLALPLSKVLSDGVGFAFGGEPLSFSFSLLGLALWLGLALLIASASSYVPARRASQLSVREILAYE
jgi:putative ABC transport system permease protein